MKLLRTLVLYLCLLSAGPVFCWTGAARVTTTSYDSINPKVAVDANRKAHIVWSAKPGSYSNIYYSTNAGGTFSEPVIISQEGSYSCFTPAVAANGSDVYAVWASDQTGSNWEAWCSQKSGGIWGSIYNASNTSVKSLRPQISARGSIGPIVSWDEAVYADDKYDIYLSQWNGTGFSSGENVSNTPWGSAYGSVNSNLVVSPNGDVTVIWPDNISGEYHINARRKVGGVWQARQEIGTAATGPSTPGIAAGPDNQVHVTYEADGDIWYQKWNGSSWTPPAALPRNVTELLRCKIAVDDNGVAHIVADNNHYGSGDIYYSTNVSGVWSNWVNISNTIDTNSLFADIAYCNGQLTVVWHDNSNGSGGKGSYNVWYASESIYVGATGTITGTVRDQYNAVVADAVVSAGSYSTTTNVNGAYALTLPIGTYNASAGKSGYTTQTVNGVSATENNTTALDFNITRVYSPPGQPTAFSAMPGNGQIRLRWVNPSDADFKGTVIRYKTTGYPTSPTDGTLVCDRSTLPGKVDQTDPPISGLVNGTTYYFAAFTYDTAGDFAAGKLVQAIPCLPPKPNLLNNGVITTFTGGVADGWTSYKVNDPGNAITFLGDGGFGQSIPSQAIVNLASASLPASTYTAAGVRQSVSATSGKVYLLTGYQDINTTSSTSSPAKYCHNYGINPAGGTSAGTPNGNGTIGGAKWLPSSISFWNNSYGSSSTNGGFHRLTSAYTAASDSISVWSGVTVNTAVARDNITAAFNTDELYLFEFDFPANYTGTLWNSSFESAADLQNGGDIFPDSWAPAGGSIGHTQTSECDAWAARTGNIGVRIFNRRGVISQGLMQRLGTTPGTPVTFSCWVRLADNSVDTILSVGIDPSGGTDINSGAIAWASSSNKTWTQLTKSVTAAGDHATVFIRVWNTNPTTYDNYHAGYFDDAAAAWTSGPGKISGIVTDNAGNPISGAAVTITPGGHTLTSAQDGTYTSPNLSAGTYNVSVSKSYYTSQSANIQVIAGETASANFSLTPVERSMVEAKSLADGTPVFISGEVITGAFNSFFYIERGDRTSGIRVNWSGVVNTGDIASVTGYMGTISGERCINATAVAATAGNSTSQ